MRLWLSAACTARRGEGGGGWGRAAAGAGVGGAAGAAGACGRAAAATAPCGRAAAATAPCGRAGRGARPAGRRRRPLGGVGVAIPAPRRRRAHTPRLARRIAPRGGAGARASPRRPRGARSGASLTARRPPGAATGRRAGRGRPRGAACAGTTRTRPTPRPRRGPAHPRSPGAARGRSPSISEVSRAAIPAPVPWGAWAGCRPVRTGGSVGCGAIEMPSSLAALPGPAGVPARGGGPWAQAARRGHARPARLLPSAP
jgi:hypothetical protein